MSFESPPFSPIDPSPFRIGIVAAEFNQSLVEFLLSRVIEVIGDNGKPMEMITERVPGSNEIPAALNLLLEKSLSLV